MYLIGVVGCCFSHTGSRVFGSQDDDGVFFSHTDGRKAASSAQNSLVQVHRAIVVYGCVQM